MPAGDAVYLNSAGDEHPRIIRIDKLWTNPMYDLHVVCLLTCIMVPV